MASPDPNNLLVTLDYSVLQQCMHCGMCLPTCPTYDETHRERNSPRGRIALMRDIADDALPISREFAEEMYYCLGCLACQTACPAGVNYVALFETARAEVERQHLLSTPTRSFYRWLTLNCLFMHPRLLKLVGRLMWLFQQSGLQSLVRKLRLVKLLSSNLRRLEAKAPTINRPFSAGRIAESERPDQPRYRVALLTGCVQDLLYADVHRATVDVLLENGCEVFTPRNQHCCGSLHAHNGDLAGARELAKRTLDTFDLKEFDAIITNAGGCGSHLKHYSSLLAGDNRYEEKARHWDTLVKDIHEWLVEIDYRVPNSTPTGDETIITYDDSCHLCHSQKVFKQPRKILQSIPGVRLVNLPEADWCCGSAGIYSISQPEQADKLLSRKLDHLAATQATIVATGNPGCQLQLSQGIAANDSLAHIKVVHPVSLLADAYKREAL
jgi:glycolate oxidase iron-sulfur subunit